MNLLEKILSISPKKDEVAMAHNKKKEVMVGFSSVSVFEQPENTLIVAESQIPEYCHIGNLIFEKRYTEAIELGNNLLKETPQSAVVHVNLMDVYFKVRNENPLFIEKSTEHARLAMLYGHNTGYVQKRLAVNLEKQGRFFQALQVCNIVLLDKFHFSRHGCGDKEEFLKRKFALEKKTNKAVDNKDDVVFSSKEISFMFKQIKLDEEFEKKEQIEYKKRMKELEREISKPFKF